MSESLTHKEKQKNNSIITSYLAVPGDLLTQYTDLWCCSIIQGQFAGSFMVQLGFCNVYSASSLWLLSQLIWTAGESSPRKKSFTACGILHWPQGYNARGDVKAPSKWWALNPTSTELIMSIDHESTTFRANKGCPLMSISEYVTWVWHTLIRKTRTCQMFGTCY